jgi:hypothetical protein
VLLMVSLGSLNLSNMFVLPIQLTEPPAKPTPAPMN